MSHPQLSNPST
ncbi:hypothetical protein IEO21_10976 [Rhodonia placenta]|uniref:Uncharacterized protein n=1 Tax=Rhodonia placenta TaxID=104341 RepID=A0A8H7NRF8_9APHY|nr:hypothetical protein IEO21_10976 [Postia placenta]